MDSTLAALDADDLDAAETLVAGLAPTSTVAELPAS